METINISSQIRPTNESDLLKIKRTYVFQKLIETKSDKIKYILLENF